MLTDDRFSDPDWIFERKLDGIRCIAIRDGDAAAAAVAQQPEPERPLPGVVEALSAGALHAFALDGEVVAFKGSQTSFARLAQRGQRHVPVFLYVFDLLWLDGHDVRALPLRTRKRLLRRALHFDGPLRLTPHRNRDGEEMFARGVPQGLGGRDRQARGQPVPASALAGLAEVQVRAGPGAGDRRLHRAARLARPSSGRCCSATTTAAGCGTPARSAPGSTPATLRELGAAAARARREDSPFADPEHDSRSAASPGSSPSSSPRSGSPNGPARATAPSPLPRACATTSRRARWCASDEPRRGIREVGRRARSAITPLRTRSLFPNRRSTKRDLARHYEQVAAAMLPHVRDRPLALQAFPEGIEQRGLLPEVGPPLLPGLDRARDGAQEGRHADPGRSPRTRRRSSTSRARTWSRPTSGSRAPTSRTSPTG